jgi:hypothetical protein
VLTVCEPPYSGNCSGSAVIPESSYGRNAPTFTLLFTTIESVVYQFSCNFGVLPKPTVRKASFPSEPVFSCKHAGTQAPRQKGPDFNRFLSLLEQRLASRSTPPLSCPIAFDHMLLDHTGTVFQHLNDMLNNFVAIAGGLGHLHDNSEFSRLSASFQCLPCLIARGSLDSSLRQYKMAIFLLFMQVR